MTVPLSPVVAIINPTAGPSRSADSRQLAERARRAFAEAGLTSETVFTEREGHARELATDFVRRGFSPIIAWGGGARGTGSAVSAAVVNHDQGDVAGIILGQQGCDRSANDRGFIPCRHYHHHAGPVTVECRRCLQALVGAPEATV